MPPKHIALAVLFFAAFAHSSDNTVAYGGQTYKTVKIGEQTWMAENLNYDASGSKCYDNNPDNCAKYGRLYDWETAMKVCPKGWHLPSNADWDKLLRFVDGNPSAVSPYGSPKAGKHLKAARGWNDYEGTSGNGTDKYGFSALPGAYCNLAGLFSGVGYLGRWWSANEDDSDYLAHSRGMHSAFESVYWDDDYKSVLFSVRCLQDGGEKSNSSVPSSSSFAPSSSSSVGYSGSYGSMIYGSQTYKTVKIGTQTWMAENLNYEAEGSKCYENNPDNCAKYGRLYNWETALKVCPKGWHLPTNEEWDKLLLFIDSDTGSENPHDSPMAGKHLRAASGWNFEGNGMDAHGFSALPGGYGISNGRFNDAGYGYWWSASQYNSYHSYYRFIYYYSDNVYSGVGGKSSLFFRIRCVQN